MLELLPIDIWYAILQDCDHKLYVSLRVISKSLLRIYDSINSILHRIERKYIDSRLITKYQLLFDNKIIYNCTYGKYKGRDYTYLSKRDLTIDFEVRARLNYIPHIKKNYMISLPDDAPPTIRVIYKEHGIVWYIYYQGGDQWVITKDHFPVICLVWVHCSTMWNYILQKTHVMFDNVIWSLFINTLELMARYPTLKNNLA